MRTLLQIASAVGIIVSLMTAMAALFYGFCWTVLLIVQLFPVIGKRHRHAYWDELTKRSGRA